MQDREQEWILRSYKRKEGPTKYYMNLKLQYGNRKHKQNPQTNNRFRKLFVMPRRDRKYICTIYNKIFQVQKVTNTLT